MHDVLGELIRAYQLVAMEAAENSRAFESASTAANRAYVAVGEYISAIEQERNEARARLAERTAQIGRLQEAIWGCSTKPQSLSGLLPGDLRPIYAIDPDDDRRPGPPNPPV